MGRGLAREEYQYLERPYRDWLPHRRVLGSWVTPPADDSSLVAYCLSKIDRHYAVRVRFAPPPDTRQWPVNWRPCAPLPVKFASAWGQSSLKVPRATALPTDIL